MPEKKTNQCATCGIAISRRRTRCVACWYIYRIRPLEERFWEKVVKHDDGCWGWNGNSVQGYGLLSRGGAHDGTIRASRLSWELHYGDIPAGLFVCHRCDNPPCTRPDHLFLGTQAENMADAARKGRLNPYERHGERNPHAKLTTSAVALIRGRYAAGGVTQVALSREFNVSQTQIARVISGESWG